MKLSPNRLKPTLLLESRFPQWHIWAGLLLSAALLGPVSAKAQGDPSSPLPAADNQPKIEKTKSASASPATSPSKMRVMTPFGPMYFTPSAPPASAAQPAPAGQQLVPPTDQATPSKSGSVPPGKEWVSTPFGPMLLDKKKQ